jgi:magnesium and cobalt exporter, CNNM family
MLLAGAVISLLILLSAFFVAAEYAAVSARRSRIRRLAEDGNPLAARLLPVLEDPGLLYRYIGASQIGITLSSLILGAYAESTLEPHVSPLVERVGGLDPETARSVAAAVVLVSLTTLSVIVGELVPKSVALQNPTGTALFSILPMRWSMRVFSRTIALLNGSGAAILRPGTVTCTRPRRLRCSSLKAATAVCSNHRNRCASTGRSGSGCGPHAS